MKGRAASEYPGHADSAAGRPMGRPRNVIYLSNRMGKQIRGLIFRKNAGRKFGGAVPRQSRGPQQCGGPRKGNSQAAEKPLWKIVCLARLPGINERRGRTGPWQHGSDPGPKSNNIECTRSACTEPGAGPCRSCHTACSQIFAAALSQPFLECLWRRFVPARFRGESAVMAGDMVMAGSA